MADADWRPASPVYLLRTCAADMTSYGGFTWPTKGVVTAPDWRSEPVCRYGLHGLLHGEGDGCLLDNSVDAVWMIVEAEAGEVVELGGKVKVPRCRVVACGDRQTIVAEISRLCPGRAIPYGTATAGYRGTATAGDSGTATAGYRGTATAGDSGTATAGDSGTATAGYRGTATAGDSGTATAGYRGTATAGYRGTATAGYRGTATAGDRGTATAGDRGTATAGVGGTATAGVGGTIAIEYWCPQRERYRRAVAEVGEDGVHGIEPDTAYIIRVEDGRARFAKAKP
jgi:hypothetical protein